MERRWLLIIGGVLMACLGLARGAGGMILLMRGSTADPAIQATGTVVQLVGAFLLLLGLALVVSSAGVLVRRPVFWLAGIICTIAFVVDGAINGYLLYGKPGDKGTVVNVIVAALVVICLSVGKSALRRRAVQQSDSVDHSSGG
jgi:hypothetical protein